MPSSAPVVFLSTASVDLKDWRDHLHHAFSRAGFRVLTQEQSLRSAPGDVRRLLTETINEADCVIHLAGMGYGSHATEPFPDSPDFQCSWTQFEYYHAHQQKKDVIAFVCAPDLSKPGYEAREEGDATERLLKQRLQETHRQRVATGDFTGTPLEGKTSRTSNESVAGSGKLMESVAAAIGTLRTVQRDQIEQAQAELRSIGDALSRLEHGQRKIGRVVLASAALLILIAGLVLWIKNTTGRTAATVEAVSQKQQEHTLLLTDQQTLLKEAVAQLEIVTREKAHLGIKIEDLPREAIYKEIAARLNVSEVELALNIEAGKKSTDALTRGRAHLLARSYDDAHAAAREAREADKAAIQRVIQSHAIDAESYFHEVKYEKALESRQKAAALVDKAADPVAWAEAQGEVAFIQHHLARYKEAEPLLREIAAIREKYLGPDKPEYATALNNLALLLQDTNRLAEAEPLMRRALQIDEASYGKDHPNVAGDLNNLASLCYNLNRLAEAELLMRQALEIDEPNPGRVATKLNNLALLLQATNRLADAEPLMRRALEIDEASYGKNHPNVAVDLNNLALLLQNTNRLAEAEPMVRRALQIDEASYGKDHPNVAIRLSSLAMLLKATNRFTEAEPLMRRALEIDEASYGPDHPNIARGLNNLAQLLQATNRLAEAEPLMCRGLAIEELNRGKDHPYVAIQLNNLARLLKASNRPAEAEPLMRRALEIDKASYGKDHPDVAIALNNLASLLHATNRSAEAEPLIRRALQITLKFNQATGHEHPNHRPIYNNYRSILESMKLPEAEIAEKLRSLEPPAPATPPTPAPAK